MKNVKSYLSIDECKDGFLYLISARNASLGIYRESIKSFTISRFKFNDNYLFEEVHWDADDNWGTAKPLKELEQANVDENDMLCYLNEKQIQYATKIAAKADWSRDE